MTLKHVLLGLAVFHCVADDEFTGEVAEDGLSQFGHRSMMAG